MVMTASTMLELGTGAPDFELTDVTSGHRYALSSFSDKRGLLVMFICRHCPFVQHIKEELARLGRDYKSSDLAIVAISSNDAGTYKDDAPDSLKDMAAELGLEYPFLHDESQEVAKSYTAACTPDFFLFDEKRKLVYRGQLDDSRPGNDAPNDGRDLRAAVDALLSAQPVAAEQQPSIGCNIKWRPGNEPAYFG